MPFKEKKNPLFFAALNSVKSNSVSHLKKENLKMLQAAHLIAKPHVFLCFEILLDHHGQNAVSFHDFVSQTEAVPIQNLTSDLKKKTSQAKVHFKYREILRC